MLQGLHEYEDVFDSLVTACFLRAIAALLAASIASLS